jgi:hypothetical protein
MLHICQRSLHRRTLLVGGTIDQPKVPPGRLHSSTALTCPRSSIIAGVGSAPEFAFSACGPDRCAGLGRWRRPQAGRAHGSLQFRRCLSIARSNERPNAPANSGERSAEPGDELGSPVAVWERQWLVMQHPHPGVAQAGRGQLVDHPMADDDAAPWGEGTASVHQLGRRGGDGGPPRSGWEVVDRLVHGVDEPEPSAWSRRSTAGLCVSSTSGWLPYRAWAPPR